MADASADGSRTKAIVAGTPPLCRPYGLRAQDMSLTLCDTPHGWIEPSRKIAIPGQYEGALRGPRCEHSTGIGP
jgi:hypothetical protein